MGVGCSAAVKILVVVGDASREEFGGGEARAGAGGWAGVRNTRPSDGRILAGCSTSRGSWGGGLKAVEDMFCWSQVAPWLLLMCARVSVLVCVM